MLLRYLLGQYVRQTAEQKLYEAVRHAGMGTRREGGAEPDEPGPPDSQAADPRGAENRDADSEPQAGPAPPPLPPCEVAFLFALQMEAGGLCDLLQQRVSLRCDSFIEHRGLLGDRSVAVIETGVGGEAAARATEDVLRLLTPGWIVSAGFAGALQAPLGRGHLVIGNEVLKVGSDDRLQASMQVPVEAVADIRGLDVGALLTVDELIADPAEKQRLGEETGALACDLETAAVAETCQSSGTPFLAVRIITDALGDRLPPEIEGLMNQSSLAGKLGAAAGAIFKRPSSLKDLWKLREEALRATDRLAKYLASLLAQLPPPTAA